MLSARFVVGCDGPDGFTRKQIGLDFEPKRLEDRILRQIDAKVRWSRPAQAGIASFFLGDSEYLGYLPLAGGYDRVFLVTPAEGIPDRKPSIEEMQAGLRRVTGDAQAELSDAIWLTRGRLQHGIAASFQAGRILLAGDAGHMTIPVYGQGMNTGMQDAFNLAWKLQATLLDSVAGLLESYSEERHTVREALNAEQGAILQRAAYPTFLQKLLMPVIAPVALRSVAGKHLRDRSAQLKITYRESLLSHRVAGHTGVGAGDRAPDAIVVNATDLKTTQLFSHLYSGGWTLLCFTAKQRAPGSFRWVQFCHQLSERFTRLRSLLVTSEAWNGETSINTILDLERYAYAAYQVSSATACFLVRPDGYIGFSAHRQAEDALAAYCARWLPLR